MSYKAIGLFSSEDIPKQGTWNDNPGNSTGVDATVTSTIKPKQDNTLLYAALGGLILLILLTQPGK